MESQKLKVGDRVYATQYGAIMGIYTIDRTTAKRAFSGTNEFKIEVEGGDVVDIGRHKWSITYFYAETPELKARFYAQNVLSKAKKIDLEKLSTEQLENILKIAENK